MTTLHCTFVTHTTGMPQLKILVPYKHRTILFKMAIQFMKIVLYRAYLQRAAHSRYTVATVEYRAFSIYDRQQCLVTQVHGNLKTMRLSEGNGVEHFGYQPLMQIS